ncbi:MAG: hypothetical protein IJX17_01220 [Clostridia bacterium]|nr:hypothetical protein [Clostridia bacterium]
MSKYNSCKKLVTLAEMYGNDMRLHGMSMYWNNPTTYEDTTTELTECDLFKKIGMYDRSILLTYGQQMKQYGMGCYAQNGACAALYDRYVNNGGVPNPFVGKEVEKGVEVEPEREM